MKKNKYVKKFKLCIFTNCKNEYTDIIHMIIQYLEQYNKTNTKAYKTLKKINTSSISYTQYDIVTSIMNSFTKYKIFHFVM